MADAIRVLYVDDESSLLDIGKVFLEQSGDFTVTTATSAPDAIRLLEQDRFGAIISDYQMPEMNGIEFLKYLKAEGNTTPFIIFTGKGREEVVIEALNAGADFYLKKGGESKSQFAELSHKIRYAVSRRRADDALKRSEEKYRHLIEHSDEAIVVAQDGILKLVNHRTVEFTGYSEQELLSMPFSAFIHPDDRAMVMERYQKRMKGDESLSRYSFRLNPTDASTLWVELSIVAIDWEGRPATLNFLTDITERKRADDALRESEERYRTLVASVNEAIILQEKTGEILTWNRAAEQLFGVNAREVLGHTATSRKWKTIREDGTEFPGSEHPSMHTLATGEACKNVVMGITGADGRFSWVNINTSPLFGQGDAKPYAVVISLLDLTERKRAEEALRETNEYLHKLIDFANAPIIVWDPTFVITRFNHAFEHLTGRDEQEVIGQPLDILFPKKSRDTSLALINKTLTGKRWEAVEIPILASDGTIHTVLWNTANILTAEAELISTIAQGVDITGRKQDENMIALTTRKLALMNDVTYQFIQNKVTALSGYTELSKDVKTEVERIAFIEKEEHILADIYQLIKNTKEYQEMGLTQLRWIPVEPSIRMAVSLVSPKQGTLIEIDLHGLELYADPLIEKIFYKLIDNAEKHGKTITRITFTCHETTDKLILTCEDDGVGISQERKIRLFERDSREKSGFDLFFIRECLALYNMNINETGESNKGARFEITVPKGAYRFTGTGGK